MNDMMTAYESGVGDGKDGKMFAPEYFWESAADRDQYAVGFLSELRAIDLAVDAAQSRPDDWTAAQRDAAPVADRSQLREDDGEIIFAF